MIYMQFAHPEYLWLLLIIVPCVVWYVYTARNRHASLAISSTKPFEKVGTPFKAYLLHALFALRMLAIGALIVILARPQSDIRWSNTSTEGTDIVLALDVSSSMLARDFDPDRLEAAKKVASQFIAGREHDNIGLVIFAAETFTAVPMTTDHAQLVNYLNEVKVGLLEDATAIGDGLATAINRIKEGSAKSKTIILLTDGVHNAGQLTPMDAASIAKQFDIRVYTIGVGKEGNAQFPQYDVNGRPMGTVTLPVNIDEKTLTAMANSTGGKYFRATNDRVLADVFDEINKLETSTINVQKYAQTEEDYLPWALLALLLLGMELIMRTIVIRNIP